MRGLSGSTLGRNLLLANNAAGGLPAPLDRFVYVARASSIDPATWVDGDPWPNEVEGSPVEAILSTQPAGYEGVFPDGDSGFLLAPSYFGPGDGMATRRLWTGVTNETDPDPAARSLISTPDSPALAVADGFFLCGKFRSIPDAASHGADQAVRIGKLSSDATALIWGISTKISTSQIRVNVTGDPSGGGIFDLGPNDVAPLYETVEIAGSFVAATGEVAVYVRDDADADVVDGAGRGWRTVGSTVDQPTVIATSTGDLQVGIGKGWVEYAEVYDYDGSTLTLAAGADLADATAWDGPAGTFTSGGVEWTIGDVCLVVDADRPGFVIGGVPDGDDRQSFYVPHSAAVDVTTGPLTSLIAVRSEVEASGFEILAEKLTGAIATDGVGWVTADSPFVGGLGFVVASGGSNPGVDPAFAATAWTGGERVVGGIRHANDEDDLSVVLDDAVATTGDASGVGDISTTSPIRYRPTTPVVCRAVAFTTEAITGAELAAACDFLAAG